MIAKILFGLLITAAVVSTIQPAFAGFVLECNSGEIEIEGECISICGEGQEFLNGEISECVPICEADEVLNESTLLCESTNSGGSCTNCQQPSIGVTDRGIRVVDDGLTVNGNSIDALYYNTPFPLIQASIGKPIDFVFKIWDDRLDNIKHVQIQLGKNKVGESFNKVASAIWDRHVMTGIETVTHDSMFKNVVIERLPDEPCRTNSNDCTVIHARLTPTEPIVGDVVFGLNIWDEAGNASTTFFNDGIQVGTPADIIVPDTSNSVVIKQQQSSDDGLGHVDDRNSKAFQLKLAWHNSNIVKLAQQLGY